MASTEKKKPTKKSGKLSRIWRIIKRTFLILFIAQFVYIILLKWIDPPITITQLLSLVTGDGLKRDYVNIENMSSDARLSVMAAEDQLFPDHSGFDWKSIEKAMEYNKRKPNRVRGASTISQQTAKNVFLWQGSGWTKYFRKGLEIYFTKMIEWIWGKKRILEVYLNVAEMGKGIYGMEAAAQAYFNKPAKNLSRAEAAMIASCLPNPVRFPVKPMSGFVAKRYPWVIQQMNNLDSDPDIQALIYDKKEMKADAKNWK
ncbi:MAG: monofunctional biosynthetic peptidoglycan transglycosylase [Sphingobacteriales bacterium]|nr:monofunctional biosynthetic peptidoglycan transglycosylase [Sphingobacteriales bacterium]MBI3719461.1 monofunctional biosynthetic peptidoglycan transglycosylase [Sphingobacteriales bacterium]